MPTETSRPAENPKDAVEQPDETNATDPLKVIITYLIVGISLFSALLAWWTRDIDPAAFNRTGLRAVFNIEMVQTMNTAALYKDYRAYTNFTLAEELRKQTDANIAEMHPRDRVGLAQQQVELARIVPVRQRFFPQRYLNRDGSYAIERELGESWAQAEQTMDLNAGRHFANALVERARVHRIALMVFGLTVALFFYTIANALHPQRIKLRYGAAFLGLATMLISIGSFVLFELLTH